jgi:hypothetical protein
MPRDAQFIKGARSRVVTIHWVSSEGPTATA